jgi:hypothetical protein
MTDLEIEYHKNYRENNNEEIKRKKNLYYQENKDKVKESNNKWRLNNKEKVLEIKKIYRKNNAVNIKKYRDSTKEKAKEYNCIYAKKRREKDPLFKLRMNIRNLIYISIKKQGYSKKSKTFETLGCSYEEFKQHLERQFKKGMSWDNLGQWHLDHIYLVSLAKDEQELIRLNHYTNFQPMWAVENITKGNKIIGDTQIKLI